MTRLALHLPLALALCAAPLAAQAPATSTSDPEIPAIRRTLEHYLAGHATGDGAHHRAAFHKVANLHFVRDDTVAIRTGENYIASSSGRPAADEAQRKRRIVFIDRVGTAAVAKIELEYPEVTFTDYMNLLKSGGEWRIVDKTFHAERKARP
jgi:hypothetical protein